MRAIDVMVRDVVSVRPDTDAVEVIKLLTRHDVSSPSRRVEISAELPI